MICLFDCPLPSNYQYLLQKILWILNVQSTLMDEIYVLRNGFFATLSYLSLRNVANRSLMVMNGQPYI